MKTRISQKMLLIVSLSALLANPVFAAFGDNPAPSPNALSDNSAPGSALPPGTYPSSPSDSEKKSRLTPTSSPPKRPSPRIRKTVSKSPVRVADSLAVGWQYLHGTANQPLNSPRAPNALQAKSPAGSGNA